MEADFPVLETHAPLDAQRLLRFVCREDDDIATTSGYVVVFNGDGKGAKTRKRERYMRPIARVGIASGQKFYWTPYPRT